MKRANVMDLGEGQKGRQAILQPQTQICIQLYVGEGHHFVFLLNPSDKLYEI